MINTTTGNSLPRTFGKIRAIAATRKPAGMPSSSTWAGLWSSAARDRSIAACSCSGERISWWAISARREVVESGSTTFSSDPAKGVSSIGMSRRATYSPLLD
ncbi:hypothetical protein IAG41_16065 [Sphingomonas sp. JC676]|uniref:hypothetical protein n=1 Tax=Sphingomonas sp. JC676 TaxID=2768065 RepID=UPI0016578413|nr:hypothetical protein [Sphingomonas sp. JC676]MBC9033909.1 hypothetical protein [Sphingomonas sp. JC676]